MDQFTYGYFDRYLYVDGYAILYPHAGADRFPYGDVDIDKYIYSDDVSDRHTCTAHQYPHGGRLFRSA